jgi:cytidylate kinase
VQADGSARAVVAIDGPSGSGKSTVARGVATALGFGYLDTGAMYRAITWLVLEAGLPLDDLAGPGLDELLAGSVLAVGRTPEEHTVTVNGHDVTRVIRGPEVTAAVSAVAATPSVRAHLSRLQRDLAHEMVAKHGGAVVEGRDIGTVIFPDARLKVWLTASPEARGRRRAVELAEGSVPATTAVEGSVQQLARRDGLDSSRQASPLQQAEDAHAIDTTPYTAQQVINLVLDLWNTVRLPGDATLEASDRSHQDDHLHDSARGAAR